MNQPMECNQAKLGTCPFCGGKAEGKLLGYVNSPTNHSYRVCCQSCNFERTYSVVSWGAEGYPSDETITQRGRDLWNVRASVIAYPRVAELEAALRDLLHITRSPEFGPDDVILLAQAQAKAEAALAAHEHKA